MIAYTIAGLVAVYILVRMSYMSDDMEQMQEDIERLWERKP